MNEKLYRWDGIQWVHVAAVKRIEQIPPYAPTVWNDSGMFSYFYIDFRQSVELFSLGMLAESITLLAGGSVVLPITSFERLSNSRYRMYCNLAGQETVAVVNKREGWLRFAGGERVPTFSQSLVIAGATGYFKPAYIYDPVPLIETQYHLKVTEQNKLLFNPNLALPTAIDSGNISDFFESVTMACSDTVTIIFNP